MNITKQRKNLILTIVAIVGLLALPIYDWLSNQKVVTFENSGRPMIQSFYEAQAAYKKEFGFYMDESTFKKEKFLNLDSPTYRLFTSVDDLPAEYKKFLASDELPFLKKESFRIVLTVKNKYVNEVCFWTVDENGKPKKLPKRFIPEK